jgi:hypothetical protein
LVVVAGTTSIGQTRPADFARGADIRTTDGSGPVVRIVLSEEVYTTTTRADLADVRVFNKAGEAVPHALRHAPPAAATTSDAVTVPHFPLRRSRPDESTLTQVAVGPTGAVVEVRGGRTPGTETVGYLLDVTAIKAPIERIALAWDVAADATFLARVDVDGSDDLTTWRSLAAAVAVARLLDGERELVQADVDVRGARARYLRIAWPKELSAVRLTGVRVRPRSEAPTAEVTWTTRAGTVGTAAGIAEYDAGGRLPVELLDLEFADATDVASVVVRSRPDSFSEWRQVHVGAFFTAVHAGTRVHSSPARVRLTNDRYWEVETTRDGGWPGGRSPTLRLGWHAHELLFVPKGEGPFTLAFGSAHADQAAAPIEALLSNLGSRDAPAEPTPATLEATRDLGGAAALSPARPWRRIALWTVLVGAVLALATLVARASRDLRA